MDKAGDFEEKKARRKGFPGINIHRSLITAYSRTLRSAWILLSLKHLNSILQTNQLLLGFESKWRGFYESPYLLGKMNKLLPLTRLTLRLVYSNLY